MDGEQNAGMQKMKGSSFQDDWLGMLAPSAGLPASVFPSTASSVAPVNPVKPVPPTPDDEFIRLTKRIKHDFDKIKE